MDQPTSTLPPLPVRASMLSLIPAVEAPVDIRIAVDDVGESQLRGIEVENGDWRAVEWVGRRERDVVREAAGRVL